MIEQGALCEIVLNVPPPAFFACITEYLIYFQSTAGSKTSFNILGRV
jgi:hypothetical protein